MELTRQAILQACPTAKNVDKLLPALNELCPQYQIDDELRLSMFVAQCLHESGGFRYMEEIWGPTKWQVKYEGHKGLGNTQSGDGHRFKGRGLIQLTGRANYQKFANWVDDQAIVETPEVVAEPHYAVLSAIWYWSVNNLNRFADADDIEGCTKAVNGPKMLGLAERETYYETLYESLNA